MLPELREAVEAQVASGELPETKHSIPLPEIFLLSGNVDTIKYNKRKRIQSH
jgi:hypothetical protein